MQLLYATTNSGKLAEAKHLLSDIDLLSLSDFPAISDMDVEENGASFRENARIKAVAYGDAAGVMTVGEDAGLEVDALNGRPGVFSARYATTSEERNQKLLDELGDEKNRSARFKTTLCLYDPSTKKTHYFEGIVEGHIGHEIKGTEGFGYDPLFIPTGYAQTFAELGAEIKNTLSHRAKAIEKLRAHIFTPQ